MMIPQVSRFGYPANVNPEKFTLIAPFSSEREDWMNSKCTNIHDFESPVYKLTDEYDGHRVVPKNFFMLLDAYQNHPEAKALAPDGGPCEFDTRGLLQRAHIVANWPPVYIGKESERHWEEGGRSQPVGPEHHHIQAQGIRSCERRTACADRESSEARIHTPSNQRAHARKNLQS